MIRDLDLNNDIDINNNYGSKFPRRIKRDVIKDCLRKRCSHSNFGVLLTKKYFSEKERATHNCTGDHCYGKKTLSPNCLKAVRVQLLLYSPHSQDERTGPVEDVQRCH